MPSSFRGIRRAAATVMLAAWGAAGGAQAARAADGADGAAAGMPARPDILVVYYSYSGITRGVAERIQEKLGSRLHCLELAEEFPKNELAMRAQAKREVDGGALPELQGELPDMEGVRLVVIGGPVWFGAPAPALASFLARADLKGRVIAPFYTFNGGEGPYAELFQKACPEGAETLDGLGLRRVGIMEKEEVGRILDGWIAKLPLPAFP